MTKDLESNGGKMINCLDARNFEISKSSSPK